MKTLRIRLNAGIMGPHAGFFLAEARGYFADEGLRIEWSESVGASAVVPEALSGAYDAVYGDINSLTALLSNIEPDQGPQAVFVAFNRSPLTVCVLADGPVKTPADLTGRSVSGHSYDTALIFFPAFAAAAGFRPSDVSIVASQMSLAEQVRAMVEDDAAAGVFGFVNSIIASLNEADLRLESCLRFLEYADVLPDFYGNALIATRSLLTSNPNAVRGLARAVSRGFRDAVRNPAAAMQALSAAKPGFNIPINLRRFLGTLEREMNHPERAKLGLGDVDPVRLAASCDQVASTLGLSRRPPASEVFSNAFLPPLAERTWPS